VLVLWSIRAGASFASWHGQPQALFTARDSGGGSGGRLASQLLQSMDELRAATAVDDQQGQQQGCVAFVLQCMPVHTCL
jgi:hypothetical protein